MAPDGHVSTGSCGQAGDQPLPLGHDALTRASISATKRRARRPAICLAASRWYGQHDLLELGRPARPGRPGSPSRAAAIDHVFEKVRVTTSGRSSSTSASADHGANWP